uniref:Uncharacterized protein n=1 Tax=Schistosoma japonicum TaxID=6182 RepID=Q5BWC0_SCHJA|nr:unknown [Schistosoma japonicum]
MNTPPCFKFFVVLSVRRSKISIKMQLRFKYRQNSMYKQNTVK